MRYKSWARMPSVRLLVVITALLLYLLLLSVNGFSFFSRAAAASILNWTLFGFSAFVAAMFLAVGALVWLYVRDRRVALLLFLFSFTMMIAFAVETSAGSEGGPSSHVAPFSAVAGAGVSLALFFFAVLLLVFPRDYLGFFPSVGSSSRRLTRLQWLLRAYIALLLFLSIVSAAGTALQYIPAWQLPDWLGAVVISYYPIVLIGILLSIIVSYRKASSLRNRQQVRLFVIGVILAFVPVLILTVLPQALGFYGVNGQLSSITVLFLPLSLGYSILRYQILVFDVYIRRVVAWMLGVVSLGVLGYLVVMLSSLFLSSNHTAQILFVAFALVVLVPTAWWLAHILTERLFFSEMLHHRRLIDKPNVLTRETFDIDEASNLITLAVTNAFETREVCLFVFDRDTGHYHPSPALAEEQDDSSRARLAHPLFQAASSSDRDGTNSHQPSTVGASGWLEAHLPFLENVARAKRPLLLSEAAKAEGDLPAGLARFLSTEPTIENDLLLVPVRAQGNMIGLLVLGERGDRQPYAGPDFEVIELLLARYSPVLETARLYRQAGRHAATLNTLYSANLALEKAYSSIEEVAAAYATAAADAVKAGAEVWLFDEDHHSLKGVSHIGEGARLVAQDVPISLQEADWKAWFYEGSSLQAWSGPSADVPSCLPQTPFFPFAWLPLVKGEQQFGILALLYARPHHFPEEERRILSMFANQCAAAMDNAQITVALRAAYERLQELDRLKDQFIMTASHELRTPLTAVQGYIELLQNYNNRLSLEERSDFIAKAQRGCDELVLMVGNIMDASRMQVDVEEIRLGPVALATSVLHVLEIMDGMTRREDRHVEVDVPKDIIVMADELRLRQIILNLVGNAFKYSPAGSPIHISARSGDTLSTLSIRDYGSGVPPEDQKRLFERFVRLERDMNSPMRGAGLGLYIGKQLVEAMGGEIWVESTGREGEGSLFAFTLMLNQPSQVPPDSQTPRVFVP